MLIFLVDLLLTILAVLVVPLILLALLVIFLTWCFADALDTAYVGGLTDGIRLLQRWVEKRNIARKNRAVTYAVCTGLWGAACAMFFGFLLPVAVLVVAPNDYDPFVALIVGSFLGLLIGGAYGTYISGSGVTVIGNRHA